MLSRLIRFILIGALLLQMGCAKTVSTIRPELHQAPEILIASKVKVVLKRQIVLHGRYGANDITWRTDKVSGEVLASNKDVVSIGIDISRSFEVPVGDIERIEIKGTYARRASVMDDDGNVIMEGEIEENMGIGYRTGCIIGGAGLAVVPAFYGGILFADLFCDFDGDDRCEGDEAWLLFLAGSVIIEVAVIAGSYYAGKSYDRGRAIERIKAQRRQQKEHALGRPEMSGGFRLQLLKVTF